MRILATIPDPMRMRVQARTEGGHPIEMDTDPPDGEGAAAGPREALLAALAGCTAMDVASILRKKRQVPERYEIVVEAESAEEHPQVITHITVEHHVDASVAAEPLRRSIELSATRYCPVSAMLSRAVEIEHRYRIAGGASVVVAVTGPHGPRMP
jgi:putative redox protein